jgi:hypothetical protein
MSDITALVAIIFYIQGILAQQDLGYLRIYTATEQWTYILIVVYGKFRLQPP